MVHEDFQEHAETEGPSDRNTGLVFAAFFAVACIAPLRKGLPPRLWALALAVVLTSLALVAPGALHPLNVAWMKLALVMQKIVQPLVLGVLFYGFFTPFALILKAMGKRPLCVDWDRSLETYWVERVPPGPQPSTMTDQF